MMFRLIIALVIVGFGTAHAQEHQDQYQKNLTYQGPITGDEIIYTLYLPPEYSKDKGPYPLIVFLHGAGEAKKDLSGIVWKAFPSVQ
jgi:predicted peptidase